MGTKFLWAFAGLWAVLSMVGILADVEEAAYRYAALMFQVTLVGAIVASKLDKARGQ